MNLTQKPEYIHWPETHYVFVEKVGPFMETAPAAWGEAHGLVPALMEHNTITGYTSLYKMTTSTYRAGFAVAGPPADLPEGLRYEKFAGGKYSKFVLTGPYSQLGPATGRVMEMVAEQGIALRDGFYIENYVNDPRVTPAEELKTEILVPTE
jgi:DNA gyrase inhibitor GyrI